MPSLLSYPPTIDRVRYFEDFLGKSGDAIRTPGVITSVGASSTAIVTSGVGGTLGLQLEATNEVQNERFDFDDSLNINPLLRPVIEVRAKISAALTSVIEAVIGLASAHNATLNTIASNAWFRFGATTALDVNIEGDDGTTDTDAIDSGIDWVADTFHTFTIDMTDLSRVKFAIDGKEAARTIAVSALTASLKLQPYISIQKASGTGAPLMTVDYVCVEQDRV